VYQSLNLHLQATEFWTQTNIVNGLEALCTCVEMVVFSIAQSFAFSYRDYKPIIADEKGKTPFFKSFLHSLNFSDFFWDFVASMKVRLNLI
jgi:hypothetical protein